MRAEMFVTAWAAALLLMAAPAGAVMSIDIQMAGEFGAGEQVAFNYSVTSTEDADASFYGHVSCPYLLGEPIQLLSASLQQGVPFDAVHEGAFLDESAAPQDCTASVEVLAPVPARKEVKFSIVTAPGFSFAIRTCRDSGCSGRSSVFARGEEIYIDYESGVAGPVVVATLTYPDGKKSGLDLPASIEAEDTGTYAVDATASKDGYRDMAARAQFALIERHAEIGDASACDADGRCEPGEGENRRSCPRDCPSGGEDGYCDAADDGACDSDCGGSEDPDCGEAAPQVPPICWALAGLIGAAFLAAVVVLYVHSRRKDRAELGQPATSSWIWTPPLV